MADAVDEPRDGRRARGGYYTPAEIAARLAGLALGPLGGETGLRVLDPACGDGAFLAAARARVPSATVLGIDRDAEACAAARARGFEVRQADALLEEVPGGFDALLGNPPYLSVKRAPFPPEERAALVRRYSSARGQFDACALFIERALELLRPGGRYALVLPRQILSNRDHEGARRLLFERGAPSRVVDLGTAFEAAAVEVVGLVGHRFHEGERPGPIALEDGEGWSQGTVRPDEWAALPGLRIPLRARPGELALRARLGEGAVRLGDCVARLGRGIEAGRRDPAFSSEPAGRVAVLRGRDVAPFRIVPPALFLDPDALPAARRKDRSLYEVPEKVLVRRVADRIVAAVDRSGAWALNTLYCLHPAPGIEATSLAALLNARLTTFWWRTTFGADDRIFPYVRTEQLAALPLRLPKAQTRLSRWGLDREVETLYGLSAAERVLLSRLSGESPDEGGLAPEKAMPSLSSPGGAEMAQVRCDQCGAMIDQARAVKVGTQTLCPMCAQKKPPKAQK